MKASLFWACVWAVVFIIAVIGIWWNPAQILNAVISFGPSVAFFYDYIKFRPLRKK